MANPFVPENNSRKIKDAIGTGILGFFTFFILLCTLFIFWDITSKGLPVLLKGEPPFINVDFLTKMPETLVEFKNAEGEVVRMDSSEFLKWSAENPNAEVHEKHTHSYSGGGIVGPLVGTALLVIICMVVALIIGVAAAVYLNEYAGHGPFVSTIRLAIMNLAGVPSIVFGLFGFACFCLWPIFPVITAEVNVDRSIWSMAMPGFLGGGYLSFQGWGNSLLAGGLTLAVMVLPVIIAACEESLKAVPNGFREASLALGATKWQCIRTAVLPYATPGILTASVLGVTRVAGETAPIMFTAAVAMKAKLPWAAAEGSGLVWLSDFFTDSVQALPYHIYTVAARIPRSEATAAMQDGSVFVFMILVMIFAAFSIYLRIHFRRKLKW